MEFIIEYLRKNIKLAFKSVTFHFKQYLCFFIALFVVQMFYGIITIASDNNNNIEYNLVREEYNYHIMLKDLNSDQYYYMVNDEQTVFKKDHIHDIVKVHERSKAGSFDPRYDLYIAFTDDVQTSYKLFQVRYYEILASMNEDGLRVSTTPLLTFDNNLAANTVSYVIFCLLLTVVSVFLLMELYKVRINHYKFTYGIYMSFGADFKKLVETSFWEMMMISLMTFIPASLASYGVDYAIYTLNGETFTYYPANIVKTLFFSLLIAAAAVILPTWNLSRKDPMTLIIAEDNSNLVISPRRSFEFAGIKFPTKYELFSIWRFRKYHASLLVTSVLFSTLFMCTLFYANMYKTDLYYEKPQFVINFSGSTKAPIYNDELRAELYDIDGVANIEKSVVTKSNEIRSHILVDTSNTDWFSNLVIYEPDDSMRATNFISFSPADSEIINYLERYEYTGDMTKLLSDDNMIIVSDSYDNTKKFSFKPGDKIKIAKYIDRTRAAQEYTSGNELLKSELQFYTFTYTEYTICAVLKDNPTFGSMPIYLNNNAYREVTGKDIAYTSVNVFIDQGLDIEETNALEENIRKWAEYYDGITVANKHTLSLHNIEVSKNTYLSYLSVAFLILSLSPLMWFFTQTLFYTKRENEFHILQAFGAITDEIKKTYITDGIFNGIMGVIVSLLLNSGGVYAIYKFVNTILPKFTNENVRYSFYMPILPLILGLTAAFVCGFLSSYIPYLTYINKQKAKTVNNEYDLSSDE